MTIDVLGIKEITSWAKQFKFEERHFIYSGHEENRNHHTKGVDVIISKINKHNKVSLH